MEQQSNPKHLETDEEDGGFAMEFRIGVVEDIEAQVEEMMRLGALGYFKEARQLSQSIAPAHQRTFENEQNLTPKMSAPPNKAI
ncbi:hypothetical protein KC357_g4224 [Hortaea werneckii]|nr:hypothetical protein KC357_g4224 [Hortaea werneckii]